MSAALPSIVAFVAGELADRDFEQRLYGDPDLESMLVDASAPPQSPFGDTLFHYLIALDYRNPGHVLNAHGALAAFLSSRGAKVTASNEPLRRFELIVQAQPRWLAADAAYINGLLSDAPKLPPRALRAWLRQRILEVFRCAGRPPRWLQAPAWPIGPEGPLVFLGQVSLPDYFHDEAAVYVFHNPADGKCTTIIQIA